MNQTHQQPSADDWRAFVARSGEVLDGVVSAVAPFVRVLQFDAEKRRGQPAGGVAAAVPGERS
jgi:hypothetical protein